MIFCHSQISLICLIYLSLPNLYFCTIKFMIMFLKVLNKVNIKALIQTLIVSYYRLTPICKTLGVISYLTKFVWKEDHFCSLVVEVLQCSSCFITCMGADFPAVELDNAVRFSILSRMSAFLWRSSKWACRFGRFFQYASGLEVLACSLDTDVNYVTTMLQPRLSLNH